MIKKIILLFGLALTLAVSAQETIPPVNNSFTPFNFIYGVSQPADQQNIIAYYKLNTAITVTGSGVSQWDDQSGNGNHLKQATDTNRPSLESDGTILFDGVDNFLKTDAFTLDQPVSIYILGKQITWTSDRRWFDGNTLNTGTLQMSGSSGDIRIFAGAATSTVNATLDTYYVVSSVFNSTSSVLQLNNETPVTGNAGTNNMGGFTLGASGGNVNWSNIQIKEVIIYNVAHTAEQRAVIVNYLNSL